VQGREVFKRMPRTQMLAGSAALEPVEHQTSQPPPGVELRCIGVSILIFENADLRSEDVLRQFRTTFDGAEKTLTLLDSPKGDGAVESRLSWMEETLRDEAEVAEGARGGGERVGEEFVGGILRVEVGDGGADLNQAVFGKVVEGKGRLRRNVDVLHSLLFPAAEDIQHHIKIVLLRLKATEESALWDGKTVSTRKTRRLRRRKGYNEAQSA
jgi:hypothetical protein